MTKRKKAMLLKELSDSMNISEACEKLGISRNTFYQWLKTDKDFSDDVENMKESVFDFATSVLYKTLCAVDKNENPTANAVKVAMYLDKKNDTDIGNEPKTYPQVNLIVNQSLEIEEYERSDK
jgi:transposase-like protein